jgi:transposase
LFVRRELVFVPAKLKVVEIYSLNYSCPKCSKQDIPVTKKGKDWKQYKAAITRATMANWVIRNSKAFFHPMYEYFHRKLLERNFAMADETPLQVLHEEGRRAQTKSYMWLFRSGEDGDVPIILYKYSPTRAGDNAVEFLQGFAGYLMCDGYSGYNKVSNAKQTACWAHIRRYLTDAFRKGSSCIIVSLLYKA